VGVIRRSDQPDGNLLCDSSCHRAALEACNKGWGVSTVIGVAAAGQEYQHDRASFSLLTRIALIIVIKVQLVGCGCTVFLSTQHLRSTGRTWRRYCLGGVKGRLNPGLVEGREQN